MENNSSIRGVNLGGWLILEKWMTPSLFAGTDAVDEYTFMQTTGAAEKIENHRKSFITETDFKWLHENGINAVRVPIGYWIFEGDDPYIPAISYLDWAVQMAKRYKLKVLIDLHGLKGSQNGNDHSGRIGKAEWHIYSDYRQQSVEVLERLAERYYDEEAVWGLEIINEPKSGWVQWKLRNYYKQAYERLQRIARPGLVIVFHDGFTPRLLSGALRSSPEHPIVMDVHWYQFGSAWHKWEKLDRYFQRIMRRTGLLRRLQRQQPIIIGEWSVVLSGEILRGRSKQDALQAFKRHGELQLEVYETALGWFYWTYKTEGRGIWHFRSLVEDGIISFQ
jgi:glucan 1,3-beta-glucosidase